MTHLNLWGPFLVRYLSLKEPVSERSHSTINAILDYPLTVVAIDGLDLLECLALVLTIRDGSTTGSRDDHVVPWLQTEPFNKVSTGIVGAAIQDPLAITGIVNEYLPERLAFVLTEGDSSTTALGAIGPLALMAKMTDRARVRLSRLWFGFEDYCGYNGDG